MAAKNEVDFDYERSKADYMTQIKKLFDEDSTHSATTIQKTIEILKGPTKTNLHKNYHVSYSFGREILVEKRKSPDDPVIQVLNYEDVFDIFIKYHIGNNHMGGRKHLSQVEKNMQFSYRYPVICLSLVINNCNVCKKRTQKPTEIQIKECSVYVTVMIQNKKYPDFRYIFIYIDKATDFVVLRPLKQKTDIEVAMEIFKIVMQFGPPLKLRLCGYNKLFNRRVGNLLRQVCPKFDFALEYKSANFDPPAVVVDKLQEWMTKNDSIAWEIGCSIVQKDLNMTKGNKGLTPHDLFFGKIHSTKTELAIQQAVKSYNEGILSGKSQVTLLRLPNKPDIYILETKETCTNPAIKQFDNVETMAVNDDVVELRIPSPENYDQDPLSQFEDSEISQELTTLAMDEIPEQIEAKNDEKELERNTEPATRVLNDLNMSINVRIQDEPEEILSTTFTSNKEQNKIKTVQDRSGKDISMVIPSNPLDGVCIKTNDKTNNVELSDSDSDSWKPASLKITDIDKEIAPEEDHENSNLSISSDKTVDIQIKNCTEIDEHMILDPNFDDLQDDIDPFDMIEESNPQINMPQDDLKEDNLLIIDEKNETN